MRRILTISLVAVSVLVPATAAQGASSLIATVRGFGHGVGLSQYGTLGYAQHGWTADRILAHYYTGTQLGRLGSSPVVRVLLQNAHSSYSISGASSVGGQLLDRSKTYTVVRGRDGLIVRDGGKDLYTSAGPMLLRPASGSAVTLAGPAQNGTSGGAYRGGIEVGIGVGGLTAINVLSLEDYVAGVVSAEVPASWPDEALRAQAVAARTYAVTTNAGGSAGNFTQYADTRSQMYRGVAAETATTGAAVRATAGRVVTYQGKPVATFFFSTSGGRTENVENSFVGSDPKPWLKSVLDPYDTVSPYHRPQSFRWTLTRATRSLSGLVKGRLKQIRVLKRGVSPRIVRAALVGTAGTTTVTGPAAAPGLRTARHVDPLPQLQHRRLQAAGPAGRRSAAERSRDSAHDAGGPDDGRRSDELASACGSTASSHRRPPVPGRASSGAPARAGCAPSTSRSPAAGPTGRRCPARAPTACGTAARWGRRWRP